MARSPLPSVTLPRYRRAHVPFADLMGAPASRVLASMDEAGDDVPVQRPAHMLHVDSVALKRRAVVVRIGDPFESLDEVSAVCTLDVAVGVPAARRGIHVSRIGHVIADTAMAAYRDVPAVAEAVAREVARTQYGHASVTVRARVPYLEAVGDHRGGKLSLEHLHVIARQRIEPGRESRDIGLRVTHLVACPCVQQTYKHSRLSQRGGEAHPPSDLLMTHSQRCSTTVIAHDVTGMPSVAALLARLDAVLFRTCNTLPRDAELALVYRAHRTPQFIEDAIRAAIVAVAQAWPSSGTYREISGRARSVESIHEYDLTATLRVSAGDLARVTGT